MLTDFKLWTEVIEVEDKKAIRFCAEYDGKHANCAHMEDIDPAKLNSEKMEYILRPIINHLCASLFRPETQREMIEKEVESVQHNLNMLNKELHRLKEKENGRDQT